MERFIRFLIYFFISILRKNRRFLRISPNTKGKLFFYDKKQNMFFSILVREHIDSITADQIFTNHDYDLSFLKRYTELTESYQNILSQNKVPLIIDCGANIGLSSIYFSREFPNAKIYSFEPEKNNYLMMEQNCKRLSQITMFNKAIGSSDGFVRIQNKDSDNNAFRTSRNSDGTGDIEVMSINSILSKNKDLIPFIIKIDIEGFEDDLFSANTEWVEKFPLLIIETHDWMLPKQGNSGQFLKVISSQNRDFIHKGENIFSISNEELNL